ncbi:hypothetical protein STENM327S_08896 [Streptomyces tendae]
MARPGGRPDEFQSRLLERPGHEEGVDDLDGAQALEDRPARGQGAHPEAGRGRLGQRAHVDDDAVRVVGGKRGGQRARVLVHQPAHEVVLHDEGTGRARDAQHLRAPLGREHGSGRVLEQGLADEDAGTGGAEGVGEQGRTYAVGVHGNGHRAQSGRPRDGQHAGVGRGLDEHGGAGRGERAQRGGQRGLAARGDQHLGRRDGAADAAREPLPQLRQPFHRRPAPGTRPPPGPGQGRRHRPLRLQGRVQVAAVELHDTGWRGGQRDQDPGGVHGSRYEVGGPVGAERDLLPGGVPGGCGRGARRGTEGAGAGPGDDQPLGGQLGQGTGDRHGAHPEPVDEGPAGRELSAGRVAVQLPSQHGHQVSDAATLLHESTE